MFAHRRPLEKATNLSALFWLHFRKVQEISSKVEQLLLGNLFVTHIFLIRPCGILSFLPLVPQPVLECSFFSLLYRTFLGETEKRFQPDVHENFWKKLLSSVCRGKELFSKVNNRVSSLNVAKLCNLIIDQVKK